MTSIKSIELSDLEQYASLCNELFGSNTNMTQFEIIVEKIITNPDYILAGAKNEKGQLLGSVMGITCMDTVGECRPFMVLENLIVSEKSRRQGLERKLVNYIEGIARERNCYHIMLIVDKTLGNASEKLECLPMAHEKRLIALGWKSGYKNGALWQRRMQKSWTTVRCPFMYAIAVPQST